MRFGRVYREVVFSRPRGFRPLPLDLYVPEDPAALCIYLHGGGWRAGSRIDGPGPSRSWQPSFFEHVAARGLAVASVDYRLSGEATFPAQLTDVAAAVAFLAEHRGEYGMATERTVAWGVSAGGHLAALQALSTAAENPPVRLDAVVCWYPPTDLDALSRDVDDAGGQGERGMEARESQLVGAPLDAHPDLVAAASPVRHVRAGAPPFLFVHGAADTMVPPRQSERLAEALRAVGGTATVELVEGGTHMFPELDTVATLRLIERSVQFLLRPGAALTAAVSRVGPG